MRWITARRRHPAAGYAVVLLMLVAIGMGYAAVTGTGSPASASAPAGTSQRQIADGQSLFNKNCSSCHGLEAQGVSNIAPGLIGVGAAAVDFQVSTGRMPAKGPAAENGRKPVSLNAAQTHAIAAYIASLAGGPAIPAPAQVSTSGASVAVGQQLFIANCAQCHNFVGAGGALTNGKYAPALTQATPTQIYEAMLTGPEAMPVFNDTTITPQNKRDIIAYVTQTRSSTNPGGFSLGRIGPVTEGLVAFLGLLFFMVLAAMWITAKHGKTEAHE
ncbi:MAG TPA: cytochrome c [Streptosporangiaceae bacterium]|nr:cytochrome c [Streptosporangiaceae bacterium]